MKNNTFLLLEECLQGFILPQDMSVMLKDLDGWDSMAAFILIDSVKDRFGIDLDIAILGDMCLKDLDAIIID